MLFKRRIQKYDLFAFLSLTVFLSACGSSGQGAISTPSQSSTSQSTTPSTTTTSTSTSTNSSSSATSNQALNAPYQFSFSVTGVASSSSSSSNTSTTASYTTPCTNSGGTESCINTDNILSVDVNVNSPATDGNFSVAFNCVRLSLQLNNVGSSGNNTAVGSPLYVYYGTCSGEQANNTGIDFSALLTSGHPTLSFTVSNPWDDDCGDEYSFNGLSFAGCPLHSGQERTFTGTLTVHVNGSS